MERGCALEPDQSAQDRNDRCFAHGHGSPCRRHAESRDRYGHHHKACLGAVEAQTGRKALTVLGKDYSEANSAVMIGVGPEQAPWRCLVSNEGVVAELVFAGDASAP